MSYTPSKKILENYADILVNLALNNGKGLRKGETVYLIAPEHAKPLYNAIVKNIILSGGHIIPRYLPNSSDRHGLGADFYTYASDEQISFFPKKYMRGLIDQIDHMIYILGDTHPHAFQSTPPRKLMQRGEAFRPFMDWRNKKELMGKFSWTLALYPTEGMAKEAGLTEREYWNQVISACFLKDKNPIEKWKWTVGQIAKYQHALNALPIDKLHIEGPDADLWITLGEGRRWLGGGGANIPSFEVFTSPDWRGTNGWIRLNQPLYRYGNLVKGIELWFKDGRVIKSRATHNQKFLHEMIATKNADKIGEFSLTDRRLSKITKFMAETLYDENVGGPNGNTHIALGSSFHECFRGDKSKMKKSNWTRLGFNDSSVHTDVISTAPRTVTAVLKNGKNKIIYKNGQFVF